MWYLIWKTEKRCFLLSPCFSYPLKLQRSSGTARELEIAVSPVGNDDAPLWDDRWNNSVFIWVQVCKVTLQKARHPLRTSEQTALAAGNEPRFSDQDCVRPFWARSRRTWEGNGAGIPASSPRPCAIANGRHHVQSVQVANLPSKIRAE